MRLALTVFLAGLLLCLPAFADHPGNRDPAVVERQDLERRLSYLDNLITQALQRSPRRSDVSRLLREARAELDQVREEVAHAPGMEGSRPRRPHYRNPDPQHNPLPPAPPQVQPWPPAPAPMPPPPPPAPPVVYPIADGPFRDLLAAVDRESFGRDQLRILQQAAPSHYFLVVQVEQLLAQFSFPREKLEAVRALKGRILDRENLYRLYASFEFPGDKAELRRILEQ